MKTLANSQLGDEFMDWPVYMARAIEIAANVINTNPNPRVGCVLVNNSYGGAVPGDAGLIAATATATTTTTLSPPLRATGAYQLIGQGWHEFPGEPHAEIAALEDAHRKQHCVIGATAFVSLEPCAHHGRTGPCAVALVNAQIARVVIACKDPNPEVSGKGIEILETAGIEVFHLKEFETRAKALNPGFHKRHELGLPWVRLKLASSLDGRTALSNGESQWITGTKARSDVQKMRLASSAIITGVNSVLKDDPRMNVRVDELDLTDNERRLNQRSLAVQPLKVVLDSALRTPTTAQILASGKVVIFTKADQSSCSDFTSKLRQGHQVQVVQAKDSDSSPSRGVDLRFVLEYLAQMHCNDVLVESGTVVSSAFIDQGWVDELVVYLAPKFMGADAMPLLNKTGIASMDELLKFEIKSLAQFDNDIKLTMTPLNDQ
ncbi:MAG: diaminohydroxyphosphoribosylaminopyrimidine deaminase [Pseudohongiellaceae bacterium]|jgi:diaminohydroxyphosphoribosylaminopyrimidine deaminase/5-amino-6-(5-phosphoribosylamino)uracil reductase